MKVITVLLLLIVPSVQGIGLDVMDVLLRILCSLPFLGWLCPDEQCASCSSLQYCQYEIGACEATPGQQCVDVPFLFCNLVFLPVCGCDGNTYGNPCEAQSARMSIRYLGECCGDDAPCDVSNEFCGYDAGTCAAPQNGQCTTIPEACTEQYEPVCGCDGVTYSNDCFRQMARVSKYADGVCCGTCETGFFCESEPTTCGGDNGGVSSCVEIPDSCAAVFEPVCGCDGLTYSNDCERQAASVSKQADGEC